MGDLKNALLVAEGARESTFDMTEELALQKTGRKGAAIHGDELPGRPLTMGMNSSRKEFFARTTLSAEEYGTVCGRDFFNLSEDSKDFRVISHNVLEAEPVEDLFAQSDILFRHALFFYGHLDGEEEFIISEWLRQVVKCSGLHGFDGILYGGIAGHDDEVDSGLRFMEGLEDLHAVHIGQLHVEQNKVVGTFPNGIHARLSRHAGLDGVALIGKDQWHPLQINGSSSIIRIFAGCIFY